MKEFGDPDSRVIYVLGAAGTGKRQVEELITNSVLINGDARNLECVPAEADGSDAHRMELISGTTYFSFEFQSLLGYFYDLVVTADRDRRKIEPRLDKVDSIGRFEVALKALKPGQVLLRA